MIFKFAVLFRVSDKFRATKWLWHTAARNCGAVKDPQAHLFGRSLRIGMSIVSDSEIVDDGKVPKRPFVRVQARGIFQVRSELA
jgi:hypothetical protein